MQTALLNCTIISDGAFLKEKVIILEDGKIKFICNVDNTPPNRNIIDLKGFFLSYGFIDLQVMGANGALFGSLPSEEALEMMEKELLRSGTICFLPTVSTNDELIIKKAIECAISYREKALGIFFGLHIEGPYINPNNRGAHPEKYIKKASLHEINELIREAKGEIKMITVAPELQEKDVINCLIANSIIVAMGHSGATYEEANDFLSGKKKAVTHLFNGMPQIHHRNPGLIPAVFSKKPFTSIVADGIHVSFPMVKLAKEILGDSLYLISDAATPTTQGLYKHTFKGDRYVTLNETDQSETLSGSSLTMLNAIKNCVEYVEISLPEAINMATLYPARVLGIENKIGLVKEGYEANLVVFDEKFRIIHVIYKGEFVV